MNRKQAEWWLAGLLDGEGYIGLERNGIRGSYQPRVQLIMVDKATILEVEKLLKSWGVKSWMWSGRKESAKHRQSHLLRVSGVENVLKLAKKIGDKSCTKRKQWGTIRRYCAGRKPWSRYTGADREVFHYLREINQRGI
jgi:intein/homing endonuclease